MQVVNINQRSARVINNSRRGFRPGSARRRRPPRWRGRVAPLSALRRDPLTEGEPAEALIEASAPPAPVDFIEIGTRQGRLSPHRHPWPAAISATVYGGIHRSAGKDIVLKLCDNPVNNNLVQTEVHVLSLLTSTSSPQQKTPPVVLDQVQTSNNGHGAQLFERLDGINLCRLRERLPEGVPERHLIWILRRTLSVLGLAHSKGILHGNMRAAHIVVRPRDHNVWLVDWCWAIIEPKRTGQTFRCLNEDYSPPEARERKPPCRAAISTPSERP